MAAQIIRFREIEWEERVNVDGCPCRAGMYYDDPERGITLRLIDYPQGSTEPRHSHAGTHATTVLKGRAIIDGLELQPLDIVLGPGGEPHGPLHYPDGCQLLSAFQGDYFHGEVEELSDQKLYRLVQSEEIPWKDGEKTLFEGVAGRLTVRAVWLDLHRRITLMPVSRDRTYLVVQGPVFTGSDSLSTWDMVRLPRCESADSLTTTEGATLLVLSLT